MMSFGLKIRYIAALVFAVLPCCSALGQIGYFGVAQINVDPSTPIRLSGYAARDSLPESPSIQQNITAQAAAFGIGAETLLLLTVDSTGVPDNVVDTVSAAISTNYGIARERIVIASTHSHSAPHIQGYLENLFDPSTSRALTSSEQQHINQYTAQVTASLQQVAVNALNNRTPGHQISWGNGSANFGENRRGTAIAPNDYDLPVMRVVDTQGSTSAILASYATHATTLDPNDNLVSGDWPGYARESIQNLYPGAVAMIMIGAAGDSDPKPRVGPNSLTYAKDHGQTVANEVQRLISQNLMKPVSFNISAAHSELNLAFATQRQAGDPSNARLAPSMSSTPYGITSWTFGNDLAMTFLEGEATVDYSLRLKSEFNDGRLWVNAYSNDVQAYIPSERILYEGGYEADGSTYWYALPGRFAHGIENRIVGAVHQQLDTFFSPTDRLHLVVNSGTGATQIRSATGTVVTFDGYTIASVTGRLNPTNSGWQSLEDQGIAGWDQADNANNSRLTEFNPTGATSLAVGNFVSLGRPFVPTSPAGFGVEPAASDLTFQYVVAGQGTVNGIVEYTGPHNNLVLTIDPATGKAAIQNESPFFDVSIDAYTITSSSGRLAIANGTWNSLDDQNLSNWDEADNSNSIRLTELDPQGSTLLPGGGTVLDLGAPVNIIGGPLSLDDFSFEFSIAGSQVMFGVVVFGTLPTAALAGDYDHNGVVNAADYNVWRAAFGQSIAPGSGADGNGNGIIDAADYVVWRHHLGSGSGAVLSAVPEPCTLILVAFAMAVFCKSRISNAVLPRWSLDYREKS